MTKKSSGRVIAAAAWFMVVKHALKSVLPHQPDDAGKQQKRCSGDCVDE